MKNFGIGDIVRIAGGNNNIFHTCLKHMDLRVISIQNQGYNSNMPIFILEDLEGNLINPSANVDDLERK